MSDQQFTIEDEAGRGVENEGDVELDHFASEFGYDDGLPARYKSISSGDSAKTSYSDRPSEVQRPNLDQDEDDDATGGATSQLPSVEEAKLQSQYVASGRRLTCCGRRFDWSTIVLSAILITMIVVFVGYQFRGLAKGSTSAAPPTTSIVNYNWTLVETKVRTQVCLQGGKEFDDPSSYQSQALAFFNAHPEIYSPESIIRLKQIYGLLCFYFATNGPKDWKYSNSWKTKPYECDWAGVTCETTDANGDSLLGVVKMDFQNFGLTGQLPPEMVLLQSVQEMVLDDNPGLTGNIPAVFGNMTLMQLSIQNCGFNGAVPNQICKYVNANPFFLLFVDCDKVTCQPTCCDGCD